MPPGIKAIRICSTCSSKKMTGAQAPLDRMKDCRVSRLRNRPMRQPCRHRRMSTAKNSTPPARIRFRTRREWGLSFMSGPPFRKAVTLRGVPDAGKSTTVIPCHRAAPQGLLSNIKKSLTICKRIIPLLPGKLRNFRVQSANKCAIIKKLTRDRPPAAHFRKDRESKPCWSSNP